MGYNLHNPTDSLTIPSLQGAIVCLPDGQLGHVRDAPIPPLAPDMVLVRTAAVALNPTDHKMVANFPTPGAVSGCDFAGTVVAVGDTATERFKVGDRVCGGVHGANPLDPAVGAFAEYVGATADILALVPPDLSLTDAAAIGGAGPATMALALGDQLGLSIDADAAPNEPKAEFVLVYGGSTATGTMALQFLRRAGYLPIATCSPKNANLVRSYGAEAVFDYHTEDCAAQIRKYTRNTLRYVLDCITEPSTVDLCLRSIGRAGGKYCGLEAFSEELRSRKAVSMDWVLALSIFGKQIALDKGYGREANPNHRALGRKMFEKVERMLQHHELRPHPVRVMDEAWEEIPQGLALLKMKKVSAEKLVYIVDPTQMGI
ncbi:GroES-like protein [Aspergillus indologenus CBS 114.80]|uniref:GroES-like protein n=1 Tax=Aspergillus indologenus CBS 114.80 TaxID=1450541 RepID=A0A2V5IDD0_9EURO|nr:GroES-like protein [Aspergillus indologenus CBS 114.80]